MIYHQNLNSSFIIRDCDVSTSHLKESPSFCSSTVEHFETEYIKKKQCKKTLELIRKAINSGSWTVKYDRYLPQTRGGETYLTF